MRLDGGGSDGATFGQESVMGPSAGSDLRLRRNRICEGLHGVPFYREGDPCSGTSPRLTIVLRSLRCHVVDSCDRISLIAEMTIPLSTCTSLRSLFAERSFATFGASNSP